jgi:hypothetical protein
MHIKLLMSCNQSFNQFLYVSLTTLSLTCVCKVYRRVNPTARTLMAVWAKKGTLRLLISVLCLAFALGNRIEALAAPMPNMSATSGGTITQFAYGDFDGDLQPDLAVLRGERFSPLKTHYSLTFSFSTGNRQSIGLTGPSGGLLIVPRDVNGDNTLDLVVTAKWLHETVAVFLNDGFGGFTSADPARFPIDIAQADTELRPALPPLEHGAVLLRTQSLHGGLAGNNGASLLKQLPGLALLETSIVSSHLSGSAFSGRAPPSFSHSF